MIVARPRPLRGQDGASMVEFAIVLPLLLLLIYGIISFGAQFLVLQTIKQAASDGARAAIAGTTPPSEVALATAQVSADLSYLSTPPVPVVNTAAPCPNAPPSSGGCISVSVTYGGTPIIPAFPGIPTLPDSATTTVLANAAPTTTTTTVGG
jgi:Flp pilus assembly protein TadG